MCEPLIYILFLGILFFNLGLEAQNLNDQKINTIKYDVNHDGLADIVHLKRFGTSITGKLKGGKLIRLEIQREINGSTVQVHYTLSKDKFKIAYGFATTNRIFHNEQKCRSSLTSVGNEIPNVENVLINDQVKELKIDQSCNETPKFKAQLETELADIIFADKRKAYFECVNEINSDAARLWRKMPTSLSKIQFGCSRAELPKGLFDLDRNEIIISTSCSQEPGFTDKVLKEELLHLFGVKDEVIAKCLVEACPSLEAVKVCEEKAKLTVRIDSVNSTINTAKIRIDEPPELNRNAGNAYNAEKTYDVPRELAQVPQPGISDLRVRESESVTTSYSSRQSFPGALMALAEKTILPTAMAKTPDSSLSVKSDSSSSKFSQKSAANSTAMSGARSRAPASNLAPEKTNILVEESVSTFQKPEVSATASSKVIEESNKSNVDKKTARSSEAGFVKNQTEKTSLDSNRTKMRSATARSGSPAQATIAGSNTDPVKPMNSDTYKSSREEFLRSLEDPSLYSKFRESRKKTEFSKKLLYYSVRIENGSEPPLGPAAAKVIYLDTGKELVKHTRK